MQDEDLGTRCSKAGVLKSAKAASASYMAALCPLTILVHQDVLAGWVIAAWK